MTTTYEIKVDGKTVATMTADFAQASSPILLDGESTPYQVADARHRTQRAAVLLLEWCHSSGGALCDMDDENEVVGDVTTEDVSTTRNAQKWGPEYR